jgi:hypothetical protein
MMILNHSPHVQIFNGDRVKLPDEIERRLVVGVQARSIQSLLEAGFLASLLLPTYLRRSAFKRH